MKQLPIYISFGLLCILGVLGYLVLQSPTAEVASEQKTKTTDSTIIIRTPATQKMTPTSDGPQSPDGPNSHWFYSTPIVLEKDTIITGFDVSMEGADASILHHLLVSVVGKTPKICPAHTLAEGATPGIYAASRHTLDSLQLPAPYGIPLEAGNAIVVEFMAHPQAFPNGLHTVDDALEPTLVVKLTTDDSHTTPVDFTRLRLDDSPCAPPLMHQAFSVPTSSSAISYTKTSENNEESSSFYFTDATTIVAGAANFWPNKGGKDVTVLLNDEPVVQFNAEPGVDATLWNIPPSYEPIIIPAASTIEITSTYNNQIGRAHV